MSDATYIHGYSPEEQRRLVEQAEFWRDLILSDAPYRAGETLLEIGCGGGAVLGLLGRKFPGLALAGIDQSAQQIAFARAHLDSLGLPSSDLRVGDAARLPWDDASVDHIFIMWVLEHVEDCRPILAEALRALRPGGTIRIYETDYSTFHVEPDSESCRYLRDSWYELFAGRGNAVVGRQLGWLLTTSGFGQVRHEPCGFSFFSREGSDWLPRGVEYVSGFIEPVLEDLAGSLGRDRDRLLLGLEHFRSIGRRADGAFTIMVFRGAGIRPS